MLYDTLVVLALLISMTAVAVALQYLLTQQASLVQGHMGLRVLLLVVWVSYFSYCWRWGGQTIGMKAWKIRLLSADYQPVSWRQGLLRLIGALVSGLCVGLGYLNYCLPGQRRLWHDRLSATCLVRVAAKID